MFDLRTMILDRCSKEDLENALIRKCIGYIDT